MTEETTLNALRLNVKLERMTNEELTQIYNEANGLDPKRHNPITTERIFKAMRGAIAVEREACSKVCEGDAFVEQFIGLNEAVRRIRERSNA